jgi:hypothetical protein
MGAYMRQKTRLGRASRKESRLSRTRITMDGGVRTRACGDKEAGNGIHTRRTSKRWEDVNLEDGVSMVVGEKEGDRRSGGREAGRAARRRRGRRRRRAGGWTDRGRGLTGFTQAGCPRDLLLAE